MCLQATSATDFWRRGTRRLHQVGVGGNSASRLDHVLLLHLEGCALDREGRVLHCTFPLRSAHGPSDPWRHVTGSCRRNSLLHQPKSLQAPGIRGNHMILLHEHVKTGIFTAKFIIEWIFRPLTDTVTAFSRLSVQLFNASFFILHDFQLITFKVYINRTKWTREQQ